jgi:hypothetical protein
MPGTLPLGLGGLACPIVHADAYLRLTRLLGSLCMLSLAAA